MPIGGGSRGEPRWPDEIMGSMTYARGYTAAALAHRCELVALGIDAERNLPLPAGAPKRIAAARRDSAACRRPALHIDRLPFSAEEAA